MDKVGCLCYLGCCCFFFCGYGNGDVKKSVVIM